MKIFRDLEFIAKRMKESTEYLIENGVDLTKVSELEKEIRISICESNAGECFNAKLRTCKKCNCFMDFKAGLLVDPVESAKQAKEVKVECPRGFF